MPAQGSPAVYGATLATVTEPGSVLLPGHDVPLRRRNHVPDRRRALLRGGGDITVAGRLAA